MILFIYGSGGMGIEMHDLVMRNSAYKAKYSRIYFIDDFQEETDFYGAKRIKYVNCPKYIGDESAEFVVAVGEPSARKFLFDRIVSDGYRLTTLIDEKATISDTAKISEGCIVNRGALVSANSVLNANCYVMYNTVVGHDIVVGNHCVISSGAIVGGHCVIGDESFLGMGSYLMQEINVGKKAIVAMGAIVFRDVADQSTVMGNPARVTKGNNNHKVFA